MTDIYKHAMTPAEHLEALRALCERLQPELDGLIDIEGPVGEPDFDNAKSLACKLFDAIKDPEECKP
jgi:hypothetical protein